MAAGRPPRSLKARALQWLAQREQSRLELRRKLLRAARAQHVAEAGESAVTGDARPDGVGAFDAQAAAREIELLLDALEVDGYLAAERFVESRVNARSARYGNRRIQQELAQHHLVLGDDARRTLEASEPERARAARARRFDQAPDTPHERARQGRFLAARGFSAEVIRRVLREAAQGEPIDV